MIGEGRNFDIFRQSFMKTRPRQFHATLWQDWKISSDQIHSPGLAQLFRDTVIRLSSCILKPGPGKENEEKTVNWFQETKADRKAALGEAAFLRALNHSQINRDLEKKRDKVGDIPL